MLEDLEMTLPVAVALALQKGGGLSGVGLPQASRETTLAQELYRLRRAVLGTEARPGLDKVLPEIAKEPHRVLRSFELWTKREHARHPHPARLAMAYATGQNLASDGQPRKVVDTRVEEIVDVYENQLVKMYYEQVARRIRRLMPLLGVASREALAEEAHRLQDALRVGRKQARFLNEVGALGRPPTHVTMVLAKRAPYRAALEGFLELNRSVVVRLEEPAFDAPLENLPYMYQVWGTLEVILAVQRIGLELGYRVKEQKLVRKDSGEVFVRVLRDGLPALVLENEIGGTIVRVIPERSYGKGGTLRSISYVQRPDIAVEVTKNGVGTEVWLFDPKYKLDSEMLRRGVVGVQGSAEGASEDDLLEDAGGEVSEDVVAKAPRSGWTKPKKVDIDKMHAYRDAIREHDGNKRVVRSAAVLYPGQSVFYGAGIAALGAVPGASDVLQQSLEEILREAMRSLD